MTGAAASSPSTWVKNTHIALDFRDPRTKVWYGDFHFIEWQPAEVTRTCLMSQEDRLTKCKTLLDAPEVGVNTLFTPSGMLMLTLSHSAPV